MCGASAWTGSRRAPVRDLDLNRIKINIQANYNPGKGDCKDE